ncbi:MAG: copper amine oxidase N-terminal domain-containing protein [Candidatus Ornithomonoglobus sp.]
MKKQIVSAVTAVAMLSGMSAFAAEQTGRVEISFKVGDKALMINGETVEVEAPYVVGEGTTLVPLRVITEAFGAEVEWDGSTQSVNLTYPDVDMTIRIGSKSATVNTHSEELDEAPELNDGTTMVPLRFISETFGATVTYDADTRLITVVKETAEEGATVEGVTDKDYIGDSFYGWTMKNPKTLTMEDRSFDGTRTAFSDGKNSVSVAIDVMDEENDVDTEFNSIKNELSSMTISIADKKVVGSGTTLIHFRGKSKAYIHDIYEYVKGDTYYYTYTIVDLEEDAAVQNELLDIGNSLSLTEKRDFYDLSNAKDGYREFTDDDYRIKLSLPADWKQSEYTSSNDFYFYESGESQNSVSLGIYSKSDTASAKLYAEHDRESNISVANPTMVTASEVTTGKLNDLDIYYYTIEHSGGGHNSYAMKDVFFDLGDYVYNISVRSDSVDEDDKILNSLEVEELDSSKIGTILRDSDIGGSNKFTTSYGKLSASSYWTQIDTDAFIEGRTAGTLSVMSYPASGAGSARDEVTDYISYMVKSVDGKVVDTVQSKTLNGRTIYYQTFSVSGDTENTIYTTMYAFKSGKTMYYFVHIRYDIYYGGAVDEEVLNMVSSLEL